MLPAQNFPNIATRGVISGRNHFIMLTDHKSKLYIIVYAAPTIGILDNWLPVLHVLRNTYSDSTIVLATSSSSVAEQLTLDSMFFRLGSQIFDAAILPYRDRQWLLVKDIARLHKLGAIKGIGDELKTIARNYKMYGWRSVLYGVLEWLVRYLTTRRVEVEKINLNDLNQQVDAIVYDVYVEGDSFLRQVDYPKRYSLCHGIDTKIYPLNRNDVICGGFRNGRNCVSTEFVNEKVTGYVYNINEVPAYEAAYGIERNRIRSVGVTRHDKRWMEIVANNYSSCQPPSDPGYVFLIGRPSGSRYLPRQRKEASVSSIKRLFMDELGLHIVVKPHPKEKKDGLYEAVFGKNTYGKSWVYTSLHPFIVGKNAKFAVSFYSGVVVDMLALEVPPIEILDLRGIAEVDNNESLRDSRGRPVFGYRYSGVVFGADDYYDMRNHVGELMKDKQNKMKPLIEKYNEFYRPIKNVNEVIVDDIIKGSYSSTE